MSKSVKDKAGNPVKQVNFAREHFIDLQSVSTHPQERTSTQTPTKDIPQ